LTLVSAAICAALVSLSTFAAAQIDKVDVLWSGLFRSFTTPPPPGEPVPNIRFPNGYIGPRPVRQTDRVPGRIGVLFGVLFIPHGEGFILKLRKVNHFPEPGVVNSKTGERMRTSEFGFECAQRLHCFAGYQFTNPGEIVPGQWRFDVMLGDTKILDVEFIVETDGSKSSI
jgi:hypothetical protein